MFSAIVLLGLSHCACRSPQRIDQERIEAVARPPAAVTVFFVDGLDHVQLDRMLAEGSLPNIRRHFVEGGVHVRAAVTSMPAVTYANSVSIITGRFPGHHGILGNLWFDRKTCFLRDYGTAATYRAVNEDFTCPTLYDLLAGEFTVNVQGHTRRGVEMTIDNWAKSGVSWFLENYSDVDRRVGESTGKVEKAAHDRGRWPVVYLNYFPGIDEIAHRFGSESAEYASALITVDKAIGKIVRRVEAVQIADERYCILLTDHGHVPVDPADYTDLQRWLENRHGLSVRTTARQEGDQASRKATLDRYDAVLITGAARRAVIHLRGKDGWDSPAPQKLIDDVIAGFVQLPHARLVCTRVNGGIAVFNRNGTLQIERRIVDHRKEYRIEALDHPAPSVAYPSRDREGAGQADGPMKPGDPLGYGTNAQLAHFIAAGWHDSRAWLAATANTDLPDFVPQVVEMFDAPRAGDIVVFADADGTFEPRWRGGHGSCLARDMRIPLYFAGPGLPAGTVIPTARLVDVMPTVLDMLGDAGRLTGIPPIDGISLLPELRSAVAN